MDDVPFVNVVCHVHLLTGHTDPHFVKWYLHYTLFLLSVFLSPWHGGSSGLGVGEMGDSCLMRTFMGFSLHQIVCILPNTGG